MDFIPEKLQDYCEQHTTEETVVLNQLNRHTHLNVLRPRMLSGHLQGQFLTFLVRMANAQSILEIGTYTGYSAIAMAQGMGKKGKIITLDCNEELESTVLHHVKEAGFENQIQMKIGDATQIIPELGEEFDFVFIDADKENYLTYFELVIDKVKSGGYILADNVLWSGKVVEEVKADDKETQAILAFNKAVQEDERVENILLPLRDGLMLIYKK